jgi:hypothetical protein
MIRRVLMSRVPSFQPTAHSGTISLVLVRMTKWPRT